MSARATDRLPTFKRCLAEPLHFLLLLLVLAIPTLAAADGLSAESRGEQEESRTTVAEGCPTSVRRQVAACLELSSSMCTPLLDVNHRPATTWIPDRAYRGVSPYLQSNPPRLF